MGAEVLKHRADEVTDFSDPALPALVNDMIDTMIESRGVGLAAPQVYAPKRIVIFFVPGSRNEGAEVPLTVMINPVIEPTSEIQETQYEACLSVPGLTGKVPRWTRIKYSFQDLSGARIEREAADFHARVVQHECDHLDGMLYPMRMTDMSTLAYVETLKAERGEGEEEVVAE
jgi:peptide deformylase